MGELIRMFQFPAAFGAELCLNSRIMGFEGSAATPRALSQKYRYPARRNSQNPKPGTDIADTDHGAGYSWGMCDIADESWQDNSPNNPVSEIAIVYISREIAEFFLCRKLEATWLILCQRWGGEHIQLEEIGDVFQI